MQTEQKNRRQLVLVLNLETSEISVGRIDFITETIQRYLELETKLSWYDYCIIATFLSEVYSQKLKKKKGIEVEEGERLVYTTIEELRDS